MKVQAAPLAKAPWLTRASCKATQSAEGDAPAHAWGRSPDRGTVSSLAVAPSALIFDVIARAAPTPAPMPAVTKPTTMTGEGPFDAAAAGASVAVGAGVTVGAGASGGRSIVIASTPPSARISTTFSVFC